MITCVDEQDFFPISGGTKLNPISCLFNLSNGFVFQLRPEMAASPEIRLPPTGLPKQLA